MLVRAGLVSSSVIALNMWQANKVHAAEPNTVEQQPVKKKIRPSEVSLLSQKTCHIKRVTRLFLISAIYSRN